MVVVSTVATPGEWQCKIRTGGVRRLAVANGPNIFQMLLVLNFNNIKPVNVYISTSLQVTNVLRLKILLSISGFWGCQVFSVLEVLSISFGRLPPKESVI